MKKTMFIASGVVFYILTGFSAQAQVWAPPVVNIPSSSVDYAVIAATMRGYNLPYYPNYGGAYPPYTAGTPVIANASVACHDEWRERPHEGTGTKVFRGIVMAGTGAAIGGAIDGGHGAMVGALAGGGAAGVVESVKVVRGNQILVHVCEPVQQTQQVPIPTPVPTQTVVVQQQLPAQAISVPFRSYRPQVPIRNDSQFTVSSIVINGQVLVDRYTGGPLIIRPGGTVRVDAVDGTYIATLIQPEQGGMKTEEGLMQWDPNFGGWVIRSHKN